MTIDRDHTEIRDQAHLMDAEGTSDVKPKDVDIQTLLGAENWCADEIDIFFDDMQGFWRWSCNISRM